ncbi:MAG: ACT domain-containing protein [Halobacteria archaeon]|nr:ACT domain-containing protein [Halobacteria archaeon]
MEKDEHAVVTVTGADHPGIVASVTQTLADLNVNIEDISQTVASGFFTMILIASLQGTQVDDLRDALNDAAEDEGVEIIVQHRDLFEHMHRI